jgi:hypothetical protein
LLRALKRGDLGFERSNALVKFFDRLDQGRDEALVLDLLAPLLVGDDQLREDLLYFLGDDADGGLLLGIIGCVVAPLPGDSPKLSDLFGGCLVLCRVQLLGLA